MVQPMSAGVACSAAKMMSPSFSRSSLSTTMTGRPAAMARTASSTGSSPARRTAVGCRCVRRSLGQPSRRLPANGKTSSRSVYFASTSTSRLTRPPTGLGAQTGFVQRGGNESHFEPGFLLGGRADGGDGEGNAVDGDRPFFGDVPCQRGGHAETQPVPVALGLAFQKRPRRRRGPARRGRPGGRPRGRNVRG